VAILISNDPSWASAIFPRASRSRARRRTPDLGAEALSPLRALLHTRDARASCCFGIARSREQRGGKYFQFRLCKEAGTPIRRRGSSTRNPKIYAKAAALERLRQRRSAEIAAGDLQAVAEFSLACAVSAPLRHLGIRP